MRERVLLVAAFLVAVGAAAGAQDRGLAVRRAEASVPTGDYWLLVIGIDNYARLPRLGTAVSDAKAVARVLQERYGFSPGRTVVLFNADATRGRIIDALRRLARDLTDDDSLLVYYAGHGQVDELTKGGSWLPVDADMKDMSTWIDNDTTKKLVRAMKARHVLLISDSCFSGDFFRSSRAALPEITDAWVRKAFARTSREAITSGGVEPVSDAGFGKHSVFAHFLLKTLRENAEPYLLPSAIHERIKGGVAINARQQTQHGILTGTRGEVGGSFVLFLAGTGGIANLDRALAEKKRQMSLLERREAEAKAASRAQAAELARREKAIAVMDARIAAMKRRLGAAGAAGDSTLDDMLALVREKEQQNTELEEMRRRAERERRAREAEIARLREEERRKEEDTLKADLAKYDQIVSSEFGKGMTEQAWNAILAKWGLGPGHIKPGDISGLHKAVGIPAPTLTLDLGGGGPALTLDLGGGVTMELLPIPAGEFMMGSRDSAEEVARKGNSKAKYLTSEHPQHRVTITRRFCMGKYEVTQAQYEAVMGQTPSHFKGSNNPVERVSWNDATEFCRKLSQRVGRKVRLPTEAEWEYACRAGTATPFHFGSPLSSSQANFNGAYPYGGAAKGVYRKKTTTAGNFPANAWGLHDMHGNLREWCSDWFDSGYYAKSPREDPTGPANGSYRVLRGGSWYDHGYFCRSAFRHLEAPSLRHDDFGFRVAAAAPGR